MCNTKRLTNFQIWMQQQLLYPFGEFDANGAQIQNPVSIEELVNDSNRLSAKDHLAIYQNSYIARLRECMSQVFSALSYALGEELFVAFADTYLSEHPSSNYSLSNLGANFADFLEATRPDVNDAVKEDWPDFMIELARFEFAISALFDQEDLSQNGVASESTAEDDLQLCGVYKLFQFRFPVRPFYSAFVNEETPDLPHLQTTYCLIIRQKETYRIALFDLHPAQFYFLKKMEETGNVTEAKRLLIADFEMDVKQLNAVWDTWKKKWTEIGLFESKVSTQ